MAIYEVDDCYGIRTDPDGICPYEGFMPSDCPESCSVCKYLHGPTNADRIRAMTDEKLTKYLCGMGCPTGLSPNSQKCPIPLDYSDEEACYKCWLDWLREEARDEGFRVSN